MKKDQTKKAYQPNEIPLKDQPEFKAKYLENTAFISTIQKPPRGFPKIKMPAVYGKTQPEIVRMRVGYQMLINLSEQAIFDAFSKNAGTLGYSILNDSDFWYAAYHIVDGIPPVFITAHVDTVRRETAKLSFTNSDNGEAFMSATANVLGGDDRGGCLIIFQLLEKMKDQSVIFCLFNGEEIGGEGSSAMCMSKTSLLDNVKLFIGLDRSGFDEFVTYNTDNEKAILELKKLGYKHTSGSFSDVSILSEHTGIACVNMSAGYTNQHSADEACWLYPIFRAIETIPKLYDALTDDNYPSTADIEEMGMFSRNVDTEEAFLEFFQSGVLFYRGMDFAADDLMSILDGVIDAEFGVMSTKEEFARQRLHEEYDSFHCAF